MPKNEPDIITRTVEFDLNNLPPLTDEQKARLEAIAKMPDNEIDYSDAPYRPDAVWTRSLDFPLKNKRQISLRIDADVLDWFKGTGSRYQTRINAVLRSYVQAQEVANPRRTGTG